MNYESVVHGTTPWSALLLWLFCQQRSKFAKTLSCLSNLINNSQRLVILLSQMAELSFNTMKPRIWCALMLCHLNGQTPPPSNTQSCIHHCFELKSHFTVCLFCKPLKIHEKWMVLLNGPTVAEWHSWDSIPQPCKTVNAEPQLSFLCTLSLIIGQKLACIFLDQSCTVSMNLLMWNNTHKVCPAWLMIANDPCA